MFPLRPIAPVRNTADEKIDRLVNDILAHLVKFVPANMKRVSEVMETFESVISKDLDSECTFVPLDDVNLYPSIPLEFGITLMNKMAKSHREINNKRLTIVELKRCLTFACYRCETMFKTKNFFHSRSSFGAYSVT